MPTSQTARKDNLLAEIVVAQSQIACVIVYFAYVSSNANCSTLAYDTVKRKLRRVEKNSKKVDDLNNTDVQRSDRKF